MFQVYSKISIYVFPSNPEVNILSVIILLEANKRDPVCVTLLHLLYCIMEIEEIGINDEVYQKGNCL